MAVYADDTMGVGRQQAVKRIGVVMPGSLGIVIAWSPTHCNTHVLWLTPLIVGWIADGFLRAL